jgi:hypothetical protein
MAMLPFCGYNMADYWRHYLNMGNRMSRPPKIFGVNWFRVDDRGKFIWPGFGDNMRVLKWVIDRVTGSVPARETPAGLVPRVEDLDMTGLDLAKDKLEKLFEVKIKEWKGGSTTSGFLKALQAASPPRSAAVRAQASGQSPALTIPGRRIRLAGVVGRMSCGVPGHPCQPLGDVPGRQISVGGRVLERRRLLSGFAGRAGPARGRPRRRAGSSGSAASAMSSSGRAGRVAIAPHMILPFEPLKTGPP